MPSDVEVVHWNPRKYTLLRRFAFGPRKNNFGDLLGPEIVARLAGVTVGELGPGGERRLLSVGSILHFASDGDVVWGSGVNGKVLDDQYRFADLDVRAVRGPKTRAFLQKRGIEVPEVYGDPGLLVPELFGNLELKNRKRTRELLVLPNLNDFRSLETQYRALAVHPSAGLETCLVAIAESQLVVASSLHAIIVAESLGIPAVLVRSARESPFKYEDYYLGTGREPIPSVATIAEGIKRGEQSEPANLLWDSKPLLDAFPLDLWKAAGKLD